jgi:hypothetical protein
MSENTPDEPTNPFGDICTFDEAGLCTRHQRRHVGRELHWATDTTLTGHKYRLLWDNTVTSRQRLLYFRVAEGAKKRIAAGPRPCCGGKKPHG